MGFRVFQCVFSIGVYGFKLGKVQGLGCRASGKWCRN